MLPNTNGTLVILIAPSQARLDVNYYGDSFNTFAENYNLVYKSKLQSWH